MSGKNVYVGLRVGVRCVLVRKPASRFLNDVFISDLRVYNISLWSSIHMPM